jgi:predicted Rdx family selenoprotein
MLEVENEKVYIEHCQGCSSHNWCTNHDESKYLSYYENCKAKILVVCPEVQVVSNQIPVFLISRFSMNDEKLKGGKQTFPRIGAFEIYFKDSVIFSKLESGQWPQSTFIANKVRDLIDKPKPHPVREVKTNLLSKRKMKREVKSIEPSSSRNLAGRFKSTTPSKRKKNANFFKKKEKVQENDEKKYSDDGFEDEDFENAQVTKEYELSLPFDGLSNKKINYSNKSAKDCDFILFSSDPGNMIIKENHVVIFAGQVGKFQLRFPPVREPCKKVYWLKVTNFGQLWECFKFKVSYE